MYSERWVLVGLIAVSGLVMSAMSLMAWRRRHTQMGQAFFLFTFLLTFYTFGYMCELASDTLAAIRFWLRVESVGIAFLPSTWVILAVRHTDFRYRRWPQWQALLLMLSTITLIVSNTSEFHHLHYGSLELNPEAPFPVVTFQPGLWYWVHAGFINLAILFGNILYARAWLKAPHDKSQQAFVLVLGSLFPWGVYVAYLLKLIPWGIDPNPVAFLVPGLLYAWATHGLQMLEVAPIAQRAVFDKLSDGVLVFDLEGRLADFNAAGGRAFGSLSASAKGKPSGDLFAGNPEMASILSGSVNDEQMTVMEADGEKASYQLQRIGLNDHEGRAVGFMVTIRDITRFSAIVEGLQMQATVDPLTKAWNRNRWQSDFEALLTQVHGNKGVLSLILIDIDNLKPVNDTYGHLSGDSVLRNFAITCRKNLRAQDIVGRYGGDEFIVILPGTDNAGAVELAERLRRAVEAMAVIDGEQVIKVSASFGVVTELAEEANSLEEIIRKADEALYAAKKAGGNRVGNHPSMLS